MVLFFVNKAILFSSFFLISQVNADAICNDGWKSKSEGSGTCSHHGGVAKWLPDGSNDLFGGFWIIILIVLVIIIIIVIKNNSSKSNYKTKHNKATKYLRAIEYPASHRFCAVPRVRCRLEGRTWAWHGSYAKAFRRCTSPC